MNDLTEITTRLLAATAANPSIYSANEDQYEKIVERHVKIASLILEKTAPTTPSYHGTEIHKKLQDDAKQLNEALAASKKCWVQNGTRIYDGNGVFVYDTGCTLMSQGVCDAHNRSIQS